MIAKLGDGGGEGDVDDGEDSEAEPSRANSGRRLVLPHTMAARTSGGTTPSTSVTRFNSVFDSLDGGEAASASPPDTDNPHRGQKRRLSDEGRPGKLAPGVHAYMVSRLLAWTEQHPGATIGNPFGLGRTI